MQNIFSFDYFGSAIQAESLGIDFLPSLTQTLTSHCMPFTEDGKIIAVNIVGRGIDIPGGHIDGEETAIEAMLREAREEAQIIVESPILIDVWRLSSTNTQLGLSAKPYLLLFVTKVKTILEFSPNEEANERLVLDPDEFISKYFGDKRQAKVMVDKAMAVLK